MLCIWSCLEFRRHFDRGGVLVGVQSGKRQLVDDTDEEIAGLLEESSSLKKLITDIKELAYPSCETEISEHQLRIVEVILLYIIYTLDF